MDILSEAKKNNKIAFNNLVNNYRHIFYKTARVFFMNETDINLVIKQTLSFIYKNLVEVKNEQEFLIWSLKKLIEFSNIQLEKNKNDINKKLEEENLTTLVSPSSISSSFSAGYMEEYKLYRSNSIVEEYLTSIPKDLRLPSILYFYANLSIKDISKILELSEENLTILIDKARVKIYEIIMNKEVDL